MYILFSIMQKEKVNQAITLKEVMPSVQNLVSSNYAEEPRETANVVQEMFECLMCTPYGDTQSFREKALLAVMALREAAPVMDAMTSEYHKIAHV